MVFCPLLTLFHAFRIFECDFFWALFGVALFNEGSTNGATQSSFGNEAGAGHLGNGTNKNFLKRSLR